MRARARAGFEPTVLRRWIPAGAAIAILLGAVAVVLGRELIAPAPPEPPARTANAFVRFRDATSGISISHPARWRRVVPRDPEVRLLAQGEGSSMLVRTADLGVEIGPENLGVAKRLTDKFVRAAGQAKLLRQPQRVTLGGLPGYLYLYTFSSGATGQRGAHAHYFLFRGQTLITLVFQTEPAERLARLAPLFDRLGETLRPTPG